ncbi:MAG TPA: hypothetical protein VF783_14445, partial [Terriglobales bacterium]
MTLTGTTRLIMFLGVRVLATPPPDAKAQQPNQTPGGSPAQATGPSSSQPPKTPRAAQEHAIDNPLLIEMDGENVITYMQSHVEFEYNHANFDGGGSGDKFKFDWQQAFGSSQRFAAGIEVPIDHVSGDTEEPAATGMGDLKLLFKGTIWKGEDFENAAGSELTAPSSSSDRIGEDQTVLRLVWGFSAEVTPRTLLSAELGYNKAVANQRATPGINSIEPELILALAFAKRFGAYLDWDNYYEFSVDEHVSTMEVGLEFALGQKEKWSFAPYVVFPLNHASRLMEFKNAAGFRLAHASKHVRGVNMIEHVQSPADELLDQWPHLRKSERLKAFQ